MTLHQYTSSNWKVLATVMTLAFMGCGKNTGNVLTPEDAGTDGGCPGQLGCADYPNAECGLVSDGCGGTIDLVLECAVPGCTAPEVCNGGGAGETACGSGICTPLACADFPNGECGTVADGCGGTIDLVADCGAQGCTAPDTCGAGGTANQCGGCTPLTCADFPNGECGSIADGCGGTIDMVIDCSAAGCTAPATCGGGGTANQCGGGCILLACVDFPAAECGTVPDGCGSTIDLVADCGASGCTAPDVCGGSGNPADHAIFCGDRCPSRRDCNFTNSSYYECGVVSDNCGGTIDMVADCGAPGCGTNQVCAPSSSWGYLECITGSCTTLTCADFPGLECGLVNDGCGGILDLEASCGLSGCLAPEICGGGAVGPNRCGDPTCPFPRRTCADYAGLIAGAVAGGDPLCGVISDGCGGSIDLVADCGAPGCGSCIPGTPLAPQCSTFPRPSDPLDSKICVENVSGCPGEVVDMELYVIVPTTCANGATSQRSIGVIGLGFELLNPVGGTCGMENCILRDSYQGDIGWMQFNSQAIGCSTGQCPNELPTGHVDTVQLRIPVNQLSGDHPVQLDSAGTYIANPCDVCPGTWCEVNQPAGMAPTARVY